MKAQVVMEFCVILAAIAIFCIIIIVALNYKFGEIRDESSYLKQRESLRKIHAEITLASVSRYGYIRNFTTPKDIDGSDYNLSIKGSYVVLSYASRQISFLIPNVSGDIKKGENMIKNEEGRIILN